MDEWKGEHGSQILHQDLHGPSDEDTTVPTEEWVDGQYQPNRLGPPPEDPDPADPEDDLADLVSPRRPPSERGEQIYPDYRDSSG
jgi:hypothetical protein